nr:unnamed protein product [Callosobruchus chinensis]
MLVRRVVPHPQAKFDQFEYNSDAVLLELYKPLNINSNVSAACLPEEDIEPRQLCIVVGYEANKPGDGRERGYRRSQERFAECTSSPRVGYQGGSLMVWAGISLEARTKLYIIPRGL